MTKRCFMCDKHFQEGDDIVAVVHSIFHNIPSRITFAIEPPIKVYEMQHYECSKGDLIIDPDAEDNYEVSD